MSRAERRRLEKLARKPGRLAAEIAGGIKRGKPIDTGAITLVGGPMNGWLVKPDAPALQPDWRAKHLEDLAHEAFEKTRAVGLRRGVPEDELPTWEGIDNAKRAEYVQMVRQVQGDGRYVLEGPRLAKWAPL